MSRKSETCRGSKTGKPLTEYDSEYDAKEGADFARQTYRRDLIPYRCDDCNYWHLTPRERQTPSSPCSHCVGKDGKLKESYRNRDEAQRRANILRHEQGTSLSVYACEYGNGWHLTRSSWH